MSAPMNLVHGTEREKIVTEQGDKACSGKNCIFFSCKNTRPGQGYHLMKIYNQSDVSVQRELFFYWI